jgi:hypothetical protein
MKKLFAIAVLLSLAGTVWGQEVLWTRYYSDMTSDECKEIISKTYLMCFLQEKTNIFAKMYEKTENNPFLSLTQDKDGDYWFYISGPIYTSIIYFGRDGFRPTDEAFTNYEGYLKKINNPKYATVNIDAYFKKQ